MLAELREACRRIRKLSTLRKTVATHRLKELRHLHALKKLAAWRRSNGFDRCGVHDEQWIHSPIPPTPEKTTASMWADVNALRKEISMLKKKRSKQRVESFLNELEQGTPCLTVKDIARLEFMIMERRGRAAAHVIGTPVGIAQPAKPRSHCSEILFDIHVCMEGNTEGRMDPESGQLESPLAGTSFEAPAQQCLSNWEMEQTSAVDDCLLFGVSST